MQRAAGSELLAAMLKTAAAPIDAAAVPSVLDAQRAARSVDYTFVVTAGAGATVSAEVVTKKGWLFVLTGLSWFSEAENVAPEIRIEQMDRGAGQLSGGPAGEFAGFLPAAFLGGVSAYREEDKDFLHECGESAYLRATVHNKGTGAGEITVLASGFETRV